MVIGGNHGHLSLNRLWKKESEITTMNTQLRDAILKTYVATLAREGVNGDDEPWEVNEDTISALCPGSLNELFCTVLADVPEEDITRENFAEMLYKHGGPRLVPCYFALTWRGEL
jgi:hypothetical protein